MPVTVKKLTERLAFGTSPHWDEETQSLYFVDILNGSIHKYKPSTKEYAKAKIGESVSFVIPVEKATNKFLVGTKNELKIITWCGVNSEVQNIEKVGVVEAAKENGLHRFNVAKADMFGRLWIGTAEDFLPRKGCIFSLEQDGRLKEQLGGISVCSGLAFNKELNKFYYADSSDRKVFQFDYNPIDGTICNKEAIFSLKKHEVRGLPHGLTIDRNGNLWVAIFNGYCVIKIDPSKPETLLQTIEFFVKEITSAVFGGPNLDELYVTSGSTNREDKTGSDGRVFVVRGLGVQGYPANKIKL